MAGACDTSAMRIGIISDTHGLLRPEACARLAGVDHIIHAGDIGRPEVIAGLRKLAPTTAIRGNIDTGRWARGYPHTARLTLGGRSIHVLHNLKDLDLDPAAAVCASGRRQLLVFVAKRLGSPKPLLRLTGLARRVASQTLTVDAR